MVGAVGAEALDGDERLDGHACHGLIVDIDAEEEIELRYEDASDLGP